jgi:hypothetical protein
MSSMLGSNATGKKIGEAIDRLMAACALVKLDIHIDAEGDHGPIKFECEGYFIEEDYENVKN